MANGQQQEDKQKKGWKKKGTRHPNLHPHGQETDVGAVFNQPQNGMAEVMKDFTKQGLRTNWGQRKVPVEKISDLEWIQANGPLGNVHPDGRKATRPEIVAARENDLNRRNQVDMSKVGQAVQERKNLQKMQEPENNPSPFKVAFGLDGQPVGFSTPKGSSFGKPLPTISGTSLSRLNRTGEFTSGERSAIRKKIQEAPAESMRLLDEEVRKMRNPPMTKGQQKSLSPGIKPKAEPSVDLGAVFPQGQGSSGQPEQKNWVQQGLDKLQSAAKNFQQNALNPTRPLTQAELNAMQAATAQTTTPSDWREATVGPKAPLPAIPLQTGYQPDGSYLDDFGMSAPALPPVPKDQLSDEAFWSQFAGKPAPLAYERRKPDFQKNAPHPLSPFGQQYNSPEFKAKLMQDQANLLPTPRKRPA